MDNDHNDSSTADRTEPVSDGISLDVDLDLKMAQIMTQARDAAHAVRESTKAIHRGSGPTSAGGDQAASDSLVDSAESEAPMAGFVLELERLANGLQGIAEIKDEASEHLAGDSLWPDIQSASAVNGVEDLLRAMRTGHSALTESVARLKRVAAEAEASANALQDLMRLLEHALGTSAVTDGQDRPLAKSTDQAEPPLREDTPGELSSEDRRHRQTALRALRSLND